MAKASKYAGSGWAAQVMAWARTEMGCRSDDATCNPVLWCRTCHADLWAGLVRRARRDGRLRYICVACGGLVQPSPF